MSTNVVPRDKNFKDISISRHLLACEAQAIFDLACSDMKAKARCKSCDDRFWKKFRDMVKLEKSLIFCKLFECLTNPIDSHAGGVQYF